MYNIDWKFLISYVGPTLALSLVFVNSMRHEYYVRYETAEEIVRRICTALNSILGSWDYPEIRSDAATDAFPLSITYAGYKCLRIISKLIHSSPGVINDSDKLQVETVLKNYDGYLQSIRMEKARYTKRFLGTCLSIKMQLRSTPLTVTQIIKNNIV